MKIVTYSKLNSFYYWTKNTRKFSTKIHDSSEKWRSVIGLEIHAQISSKSKLFSGASTRFGEPVNSCVSIFDAATPGTLPILNKKCVEAGVLTALALSCKINEVSHFDRKHYFYADSPAGYQITQQRQPLAINGELKFNVFTPGIHKTPYVKRARIKQIQLEQDSGKSLHEELRHRSLVDLNRAGIPLIELVFEPDLADGEEAAGLVKELMNILQRIKTCTCKMEEGALRVDANISVHKLDEPLGTRTEVKNIGSVRGVASAIKYEIQRQRKLLNNGEKIVNETLAWDALNQKTVSMRDKEEKQDYRFMPEPNLPPLRLHIQKDSANKHNLIDVNKLAQELPRLPEEIREYFKTNLGLTAQTAISIVNDDILTQLFEDILNENNQRNPKKIANVLLMELLGFVNRNNLQLSDIMITSKQIGELVDLLEDGTINLNIVPKVFENMMNNQKKMPAEIVNENDWLQINDDQELKKLAEQVINDNPKMVTKYKNGKKKLFIAILGEVAKKTSNRANMKKINDIMMELLK